MDKGLGIAILASRISSFYFLFFFSQVIPIMSLKRIEC